MKVGLQGYMPLNSDDKRVVNTLKDRLQSQQNITVFDNVKQIPGLSDRGQQMFHQKYVEPFRARGSEGAAFGDPLIGDFIYVRNLQGGNAPSVIAHEAGHFVSKHANDALLANEAEANLVGYSIANRLNPKVEAKERYLAGTAGVQAIQEKGNYYQPISGGISSTEYLRNKFTNERLNELVNEATGGYQPPLARVLSSNPNPNAQVLPSLQRSTPAQQQAMQAGDALAMVDNAVGNSPVVAAQETRFAPRTIQRSPRVADMPPDPVPVFTDDPRFPSRTVNEVHQQLRQQGAASGGVTGNNAPDFPYEVRTQAGENILPTGLNANQAVAIVDDALSNNPVAPVAIPTRSSEYSNRGLAIGEASGGPSSEAYQQRQALILDEIRNERSHPAFKLMQKRSNAEANYSGIKNRLNSPDFSPQEQAMLQEQMGEYLSQMNNLDRSIKGISDNYDQHPAAHKIGELQRANADYDNLINQLGSNDLDPGLRQVKGEALQFAAMQAKQRQAEINDIESRYGTGKPGVAYQAPVVEKQIPLSASMNEDDYYDLMYQNKVNQDPYGLPPVNRNPYAGDSSTDRIVGSTDNRGSGRTNQLLQNTLATGAAVGGGLGAMALVNNALGGGNSSGGDVVVTPAPAPTPRAHFVIDKATNTAQSFIDRGDGQLQPYKTMDVQGARDAWSKAKQAGWSTSFE